MVHGVAGGWSWLVIVLRPQERAEQGDARRDHEAPAPRRADRLETCADNQGQAQPERGCATEDAGQERSAEAARTLKPADEDGARTETDDHARDAKQPEDRTDGRQQIGRGNEEEGEAHQLERAVALRRHRGRQLRQRMRDQQERREQSDGTESHRERVC